MLTVNTLGKFQIREADVVLDDDKIRSTRLSNRSFTLFYTEIRH